MRRWIAGLAVLCAAALAGAQTAPDPAASPKRRSAAAEKAAASRLVIPKVEPKDRICFALYTAQAGVLKLTAQFYPLADDDAREARLEIEDGAGWREAARATIRENEYGSPKGARSWTAHFRVENWDQGRDWRYRVVALGGVATYEGRIRRDPVDKEEIVVAAFTGNSNKDRRLKPDLVANIQAQDPDLLFFSGDQSYDHKEHLPAWLLFGRQFGEIIRDRPTVCLPDDHDIGQANLWGAGGRQATTAAGDDGGYFMPVEYVNEVQWAQMSHLPDPVDPAPIERGITVHFTRLTVGGVDFAIIEDRKFKSGPKGLIPKMGPRSDHVTQEGFDPRALDVAGAQLLGDRQLKFLSDWARDWRGATIKCVLSQTVLANASHLSGSPKNRVLADLDSNGWPQAGRNRALDEIRRGFAFMLCGDQHLATVIHHGIEDWNDAGVSFCVPSIVNYYNRYWVPLEPPVVARAGALPALGSFFDGLGNRITMLAYANPDPARDKRYGGEWGARADGHGLVRFNRRTREIRMECWPRGVDVTAPDAEQFPGWPVATSQFEQYGRRAAAELPAVRVAGMTDPVVQVADEASGEILYTLRIAGSEWTPKVFSAGAFAVSAGEPGTARWKTVAGVRPRSGEAVAPLVIDLRD